MASPTLSANVRTRLSIMMFLQYAFNGIWVIPLVTYLSKVGYTGAQIGDMYGTIALGFIISPFIVGMIADRFFSAQKVLGVLNILAAVALFAASEMAVDKAGAPQPYVFYWFLFAHCICYTPSWALTNTIALNQMADPGRQFPSIRVMGTIGWIVVSAATLFSKQITEAFGVTGSFEATKIPMQIGAGIGVVAGLLAFLMPRTPPKSTGQKPTVSDLLGLKSLGMLKDRNFAIFALCSFLIMLPGTFYWTFCNGYLNELQMTYAQFKQSIGQMSEMVFLFCMPIFFARLGVKKMLLVGMLAWTARFLCFGYGDVGSMAFLLYIGLALHGVCFDFFFVTGQLYTDKKAPKQIQAQAQGFISLLTFGIGWWVGARIAGMVVDHYKQNAAAGATVTELWRPIWMVPAIMAVVISLIFVLLFNDKTVVGREEGDGEVEPESAIATDAPEPGTE